MAQSDRSRNNVKLPLPAPVVALAGWIVPGLGYVLIGQYWRGLIAGTTIILMYLMGTLIGGVRVVDVPGFDSSGARRMVSSASGTSWALLARPLPELADKPPYIAQLLAGTPTLVASIASVHIAPRVQKSRARLSEIGMIYTVVAGLLNLIILIDSGHRSIGLREELMEKYPHLIG